VFVVELEPSVLSEADSPLLKVAVLYEDSATRDHAAFVATHLAARLGGEVKLQTSWWRIHDLCDPRVGWEATEAAVGADVIVFALHAGREIPPEMRNWVESWVDSREHAVGAIAGLIGITSSPDNWISPRHQFLQQLAMRAGMDYLPQGYFDPHEASARALADVAERTETVTPILKEILDQPAHRPGTIYNPASHWGLNE
jgi:hypothetical protein